jgi:hypothetical protein
MSRDALLARGRAAALAGMTDSCTIRRVVSSSVDPFTGAETPTYSTLYTGACRVQQSIAQADPHDVGEDHVLLLRLEFQLPISVTGLKVRDEITVTASPHDPDLVGRPFLVRDLFHKTDATSRRVQATERTGS